MSATIAEPNVAPPKYLWLNDRYDEDAFNGEGGYVSERPHPQQIKAGIRRLMQAADLIEQEGWTRGHYAADADGQRCEVAASCAIRFCLAGAIQAVTHGDKSLVPHDIADFAMGSLVEADGYTHPLTGDPFRRNYIGWNDRGAKNRRQVVLALRRAARRLSAEAGYDLTVVA